MNLGWYCISLFILRKEKADQSRITGKIFLLLKSRRKAGKRRSEAEYQSESERRSLTFAIFLDSFELTSAGADPAQKRFYTDIE
jgi:hypothetical protein